MEIEPRQWWKTALLGIALLGFVYWLVDGEIKSYNGTTQFCKEQCTYTPDTKTWNLNVQSAFDEAGVSATMPTSKSFGEKDLDECIKYCRDLGNDLRNAQR
jgi:hypothetical protein